MKMKIKLKNIEKYPSEKLKSVHGLKSLLVSNHELVMFELTCNGHTDDGVFDVFRRFLTTFRRFPKLFLRLDERSRTLPKYFRRLPTFGEDFRGRPEDFSIIH